MANWICVVLLVVFLALVGIFIWTKFFHRQPFVRDVVPPTRGKAPSPSQTPPQRAVPQIHTPRANVTFSTEPDPQLIRGFDLKPTGSIPEVNPGVQVIPQLDDAPTVGTSHSTSASGNTGNTTGLSGNTGMYGAKSASRRDGTGNPLPKTKDGVEIDMLKKQRETPRPRVATGLSRLAQMGDPIRGDVKISQTSSVEGRSRYGGESRRRGIF